MFAVSVVSLTFVRGDDTSETASNSAEIIDKFEVLQRRLSRTGFESLAQLMKQKDEKSVKEQVIQLFDLLVASFNNEIDQISEEGVTEVEGLRTNVNEALFYFSEQSTECKKISNECDDWDFKNQSATAMVEILSKKIKENRQKEIDLDKRRCAANSLYIKNLRDLREAIISINEFKEVIRAKFDDKEDDKAPSKKPADVKAAMLEILIKLQERHSQFREKFSSFLQEASQALQNTTNATLDKAALNKSVEGFSKNATATDAGKGYIDNNKSAMNVTPFDSVPGPELKVLIEQLFKVMDDIISGMKKQIEGATDEELKAAIAYANYKVGLERENDYYPPVLRAEIKKKIRFGLELKRCRARLKRCKAIEADYEEKYKNSRVNLIERGKYYLGRVLSSNETFIIVIALRDLYATKVSNDTPIAGKFTYLKNKIQKRLDYFNQQLSYEGVKDSKSDSKAKSAKDIFGADPIPEAPANNKTTAGNATTPAQGNATAASNTTQAAAASNTTTNKTAGGTPGKRLPQSGTMLLEFAHKEDNMAETGYTPLESYADYKKRMLMKDQNEPQPVVPQPKLMMRKAQVKKVDKTPKDKGSLFDFDVE